MSTSTRCTECKKKVGLFGFKCKCADDTGEHRVFCSVCRIPKHTPDDQGHTCTFDYRQLGRDIVEKNNPKLLILKVDNI